MPESLNTAIDAITVAADPVSALDAVVRHLRLRRGDDDEAPARRLAALLDALEHDAGHATALHSNVEKLLSTRRLVGFFADSGVLPLTGFFTELGRIVTDHLLPPLPDEQDLRGVVRQVFD
jgi:site-specific recombinase